MALGTSQLLKFQYKVSSLNLKQEFDGFLIFNIQFRFIFSSITWLNFPSFKNSSLLRFRKNCYEFLCNFHLLLLSSLFYTKWECNCNKNVIKTVLLNFIDYTISEWERKRESGGGKRKVKLTRGGIHHFVIK